MIILVYLRVILGIFENIFFHFVREGIWVVGFFYLLNKAIKSEKLKKLSKIVIIGVLAILFLHTVLQFLNKFQLL